MMKTIQLTRSISKKRLKRMFELELNMQYRFRRERDREFRA